MITYNFSAARQKLSSLLDQATGEGEVRIRRKDGRMFSVRPVRATKSPLDVPGLDLGLGTAEIIRCVREGRSGRAYGK
jgi:hypothetical protein